MKYIVILITGLCLSSCTHKIYQVANIFSSTVKSDGTKLAYVNDSIQLSYNFWDNGDVRFTIFNTSGKTIYIDWSKCNFIASGRALNYYEGLEKTRVTGSGKMNSNTIGGAQSSYLPYASNGTWWAHNSTVGYFEYNSTKVREERITHIPTNSGIVMQKFSLKNYFSFPDIALHDDSKQVIYNETFSKSKTPLMFRNFITYSFDDKINNSIEVDNEFWIDELTYTLSGKGWMNTNSFYSSVHRLKTKTKEEKEEQQKKDLKTLGILGGSCLGVVLSLFIFVAVAAYR